MKPRLQKLLDLFQVAVSAADPQQRIPPVLPEPPKGKTVVVAAGKAAASMARAVEQHWHGPLYGVAVTRYGHAVACERIEVLEAAHPVPDQGGANAARALLDAVQGLNEDDLVLCLMSGGGSALLTLPAEGISLAAKQDINRKLLASGARISEMNTVRKHLSAIKGGRLAQAAVPAKVLTIGISDVPGDDPSVIASGPTVPDETTRRDALDVLERYRIEIPDEVRAHLADPLSETPKPGAACFETVRFVMAAKPADMLEAVVEQGRLWGYEVISLGADIEGEARIVGAQHARIALEAADRRREGDRPILIVSGGETTVTVKRPGGRGGRNLEYLFSLGISLHGHESIHALACDTDGIDGSEDNAGGLLEPDTLARAHTAGVDPAFALACNDAYAVFKSSGSLVVCGPTLTNVNDIRLILIC